MLTKQTMIDKLVIRTKYLYNLSKRVKDNYDRGEERTDLLVDKLVTASEDILDFIRNFSIDMGCKTKEEVLETASTIQNITVQKDGNILKIELPFLLPRKKQKSKYITEPLAFELLKASKTMELKMQEKVVIIFVHVYDEALSSAKCYDYDNLESKSVLDVINCFTLQDDGPEYCSVHHKMQRGDKNKTVIYVVPEKEFFTKFGP